MLVILPVFPVPAPFKAMRRKQQEAQILMINLAGEIRFPIQIGFSGDRFNDSLAVQELCVRIVQRVNVNGKAEAVLGILP